ncbi:hypothetical protein B4100_1064 [Heyndrickxia coagulans]|nr:hypothetical protein B4100_1064 [Heyndrickxia coagulans]
MKARTQFYQYRYKLNFQRPVFFGTFGNPAHIFMYMLKAQTIVIPRPVAIK